MNTIGDRIRIARLARKWSAAELAKRAGYKTQSGISNLENRSTGTGGNKVAHIAKVLGVSIEWIMNDGDPEKIAWVSSPGDVCDPSPQANEPLAVYQINTVEDVRTQRLLAFWSELDPAGKDELLGRVEFFVAGRRPHTDGNALQMAG